MPLIEGAAGARKGSGGHAPATSARVTIGEAEPGSCASSALTMPESPIEEEDLTGRRKRGDDMLRCGARAKHALGMFGVRVPYLHRPGNDVWAAAGTALG